MNHIFSPKEKIFKEKKEHTFKGEKRNILRIGTIKLGKFKENKSKTETKENKKIPTKNNNKMKFTSNSQVRCKNETRYNIIEKN